MMSDVDSLAPRTFVVVCKFGYMTEMTQHLSTTQKALVSRRMAAPILPGSHASKISVSKGLGIIYAGHNSHAPDLCGRKVCRALLQ